MSDPTPEFHDALQQLEDAYVAGLRAFCMWMAESWRGQDEAEWTQFNQEPYPGDAYRDGWNAAVGSMLSAMDYFLGEHGH